MTADHEKPLVAVIMGSDSDLPTMRHAADVLARFGVAHEVRIVSAHRTPEHMERHARGAAGRGLKVIIAAAGGSAHLPGMVASSTRLPVLGVAIESKPDPLNSALGSMVRMPEGVPLATMGKNEAAAANAGLEAVRILALGDDDLARAYERYIETLAQEVMEKDAEVSSLGAEKYLAERRKADG